jgi:hypothetical protein
MDILSLGNESLFVATLAKDATVISIRNRNQGHGPVLLCRRYALRDMMD